MKLQPKPYLIIPKLIEQSTWGGEYILQMKNWSGKGFLKDRKIGQSYELFGDSKLALEITDTTNNSFIPELGFADKPDILENLFKLKEDKDFITLSKIVAENPAEIIGEKIHKKYGIMPLLIKINQAAGNSFQLHVKPGTEHPRWKAKPESWYYLEDGAITCGIKKDTKVKEYKKVCHEINDVMKKISANIMNKKISLAEGKLQAKLFILSKNPWGFVNKYDVKKYDLVDLSAGAVHHSWEEDKAKFPLGNIVYEVQMDVMDPVCTIRSFDQGKIKEDGSVRELHIDAYFEFLDTDPKNNDIENLRKQRQGNQLLHTPYYSLHIFEIDKSITDKTGESFVHLYVRDGEVNVITENGTVHMTQGHSCFLPKSVGKYEIKTHAPQSVILKTFIES